MLDQALQDAMNQQIRKEIHSAYLYLGMAAYCDSANLPGFAQWLKVQFKEEMEHAMKFYDFINDRGGKVVLEALDKPTVGYKSALDVFESTLAHEQKITASINGLYELAQAKKDYPTQVFLQWFISEQVEEEKNATQIVENLKAIGDKAGSLLYLDKHLGKRGK